MTTPPRDRWLFLGSTVLLATVVLAGLAREQRWGQTFIPVQFISRDASGLRPGLEVRLSGLPIGQVQSLTMQPDASVRVRLQIQERYRKLVGRRSRASLGQEGLVGDHYVVITPDRQQQGTAAPGVLTVAYQQPIVLGDLSNQLAQTQKALQSTLDHARVLTGRDMPALIGDARHSLRSVDRLAVAMQSATEATTPDLRRTLQQADRTGASAQTTATQAQLLLQETRPLLRQTLEEMQDFAHRSNRLLKSLGGLFGEPSP